MSAVLEPHTAVAQAAAAYKAAQSRWNAVAGSDAILHDVAAAEMFAAEGRLRAALRDAREAEAAGRPVEPIAEEEPVADPWWHEALGYAALALMVSALGLEWFGSPGWAWVGLAGVVAVAGVVWIAFWRRGG